MPLRLSTSQRLAALIASLLAAAVGYAPAAQAADRPPLLDDADAVMDLAPDCIGMPSPLGLAGTGYDGSATATQPTPTTGQVYYVDLTWYVNPGCARSTQGASVFAELGLPTATTLAISAAHPVRCWNIEDTDPVSWVEFTDGCPQTGQPSTTVLPQGGLTFLPAASSSGPASATWHNDPGTGYTLRVPVVSTQPLDGTVTSTNCTACLSVGVWMVGGGADTRAYPYLGVKVGGSPTAPTPDPGAGGTTPPPAPTNPPAPTSPTAPSLTLAPVTLTPRAAASWTPLPGASSYQVGLRRAALGRALGREVVATVPATTWRALVSAGSTSCVRVRAVGAAGAPGAWSGTRCTSAPLAARSIRLRAGWKRVTGSGYLQSGAVSTSTAGASIAISGVRADAASLVATTCPTCGSIRVLDDAQVVATLSLHSRTLRHRVVLPVRWGTRVRSGTLHLVAQSSRPVTIEGIVLRSGR